MAKRGRPSKKVMKRRKELKRQCQKFLFVAILILIGFGVFAFFLITKQGF